MSEVDSDPSTLESRPRFFPVSPNKLVVMTLIAAVPYELYWFYKNWQIHRQRTGVLATPLARALFSAFFCHALFAAVYREAKAAGVPPRYSPWSLTLVWMLIHFTYVLPKLANVPEEVRWISFLSVAPLVQVQRTINRLNRAVAPAHHPNDRLTGWNIPAVVLGCLIRIWDFLDLLGLISLE